jgi:hypothetical protein
LYVGTLLAATGFALMVGTWISLAALAAFLAWFFGSYFPRKDAVESDRLEARYGAPFVAYRAEVRALIPRLRPFQPSLDQRASVDADSVWSLTRYSENNELGTLLGVVACLIAFAVRGWMAI